MVGFRETKESQKIHVFMESLKERIICAPSKIAAPCLCENDKPLSKLKTVRLLEGF